VEEAPPVNPGYQQPDSPVPVSGQPSAYSLELASGEQGYGVALTVHTPQGSHTTFIAADFWTAYLFPRLSEIDTQLRAAVGGLTPITQKLHLPHQNGHQG